MGGQRPHRDSGTDDRRPFTDLLVLARRIGLAAAPRAAAPTVGRAAADPLLPAATTTRTPSVAVREQASHEPGDPGQRDRHEDHRGDRDVDAHRLALDADIAWQAAEP